MFSSPEVKPPDANDSQHTQVSCSDVTDSDSDTENGRYYYVDEDQSADSDDDDFVVYTIIHVYAFVCLLLRCERNQCWQRV